MQRMEILVSGAGVAGPALAHELVRHGHRPTVVERSSGPRGGGYAVDFRGPVHLTVLRRMGLLERIERHRTRMGAQHLVDADDRTRATMPAEVFSGDVEILRGDLARVLYDATRADVEYRFGDSIAALQEVGDRVRVRFEHAAPHDFDLVVGADGLHSNVRRLVFGPQERFSHPLGLCSAIFTMPNVLGLRRTGRIYSEPGRTAGLACVDDGDRAIASLHFARRDPVVDHRDAHAQRRIVAETFAGAGWIVPRLLEHMTAAEDFVFDAAAQIRMDAWSKGRVVLLGDAGYAAGPGGNGTGTAVVGAYVLAGELAAAAGRHRVAFERYERIMRTALPAARKQAEGSAGFLAPTTRKQIEQRDRFFRMLPYLPVKRLIRHLATRSATRLRLPDYAAPRVVDHTATTKGNRVHGL